MLHYVGISWIVETNQQFKYDIDKHNPYLITYGPQQNTYICTKLHGTVFENYIRNERTDRYILMCYIYSHEDQHPSYFDDGTSVGVNALPPNLAPEALISLGATSYFIDFWLK